MLHLVPLTLALLILRQNGKKVKVKFIQTAIGNIHVQEYKDKYVGNPLSFTGQSDTLIPTPQTK